MIRVDNGTLRTQVRAMHELALMDCVVSAVSEQFGNSRVFRVRLEVGKLAAVVPEALRFCFEVCAQGTVMEGAVLEIVEGAGSELLIKELEVA